MSRPTVRPGLSEHSICDDKLKFDFRLIALMVANHSSEPVFGNDYAFCISLVPECGNATEIIPSLSFLVALLRSNSLHVSKAVPSQRCSQKIH